MSITRTLRPLALTLTLALAGIGLGAGSASAAKTPQSQVYVCVTTHSKTLHLATKQRRCSRGQRKISWGMRGSTGKRGKTGRQGGTGPQGPQGPAGPKGAVDDASLQTITDRLDALESSVKALQTENAALKTRLDTLTNTLQGVSRNGNTLRLDGMNLQIVNGAGATDSTNGLGNVIVGYNAGPGTRTGSHNLVVGDGQTFTSHSGLVVGKANSILQPYAVALGESNRAEGNASAVLGGQDNVASGLNAGVLGGQENIASGKDSATVGGFGTTASGSRATVLGGSHNVASGQLSAVVGGALSTASGTGTSVISGDGPVDATNAFSAHAPVFRTIP